MSATREEFDSLPPAEQVERVNELASRQWLHMLNSATLQSKLQNGPKLKAMLSSGGKPNEIAEDLYLTILSRLPTEEELEISQVDSGKAQRPETLFDLTWALINSAEFLYRH